MRSCRNSNANLLPSFLPVASVSGIFTTYSAILARSSKSFSSICSVSELNQIGNSPNARRLRPSLPPVAIQMRSSLKFTSLSETSFKSIFSLEAYSCFAFSKASLYFLSKYSNPKIYLLGFPPRYLKRLSLPSA